MVEALGDDLNTPLAIARMHELTPAERAATLNALGFAGNLADPRKASVDTAVIDNLITARSTARADKDWAESDRIRDELDAMGIQLKDSKNADTGEIETTWEVKR